jgi:hypothetical protein
MAIPSRQIGWGTEDNLLWQISKQLEQLTNVTAKGCTTTTTTTTLPAYRVYTALLTQSGSDTPTLAADVPLVIGFTYEILDDDSGTVDFTNVGAPNNNIGTFFMATGTTPTSWGINLLGQLLFNSGAPTVKVLENTIGNIWFTYNGVGIYDINSNNLFTSNKTASFISGLDGAVGSGGGSPLGTSTSINNLNNSLLNFVTTDSTGTYSDSLIDGYPIEIRVYN